MQAKFGFEWVFLVQGRGGAYEISQRMTALLGWGATTKFSDDWTWDQASETYVLDEEMAAKLRESNPGAFRNAVKRMLEAAGRGLWNADKDTLARLQEVYDDLDEQLEKGV
jgi:magnesium chelatase subunit H